MTRHTLLLAGVMALAFIAEGVAPPLAEAGPGQCTSRHDDRAERPAPDALLPRLGRVFGVAPTVLHGTSYVRCAGSQLLGCMIGANLNCGHANVSRRSEGGNAYCHDNPGSDVVPMAATGHETIYDWHCVGSAAVVGRTTEDVDRLGFVTRNWRVVR